MKIGILSDAHGNLEGFKRCRHYLMEQQVDEIIFLGDAIGYMPDGLHVLELLQSFKHDCLMGNHEAMLLGHLPLTESGEEVYRLRQFCQTISEKHLEFISSWVPFREKTVDNKSILFVHGSPWNPINGYVYPDFDKEKFNNLPYDVIIMGHSHRPFFYKNQGKTIINAGSCGLPRDQGHLLSCAILDTKNSEGEVIRIPLDVEKTIGKFEKVVHKQVLDCFRR